MVILNKLVVVVGGGGGIKKVWVVVCHRGPSPFFRQKFFSSAYPVYFLTLIPFLYKRLPVERDKLNSETLFLLCLLSYQPSYTRSKHWKPYPVQRHVKKGLSLKRGGRELGVTPAMSGCKGDKSVPAYWKAITSAMEIFGQNNYFYVLTRLISSYISSSPRWHKKYFFGIFDVRGRRLGFFERTGPRRRHAPIETAIEFKRLPIDGKESCL